jgi:hypothetical protein
MIVREVKPPVTTTTITPSPKIINEKSILESRPIYINFKGPNNKYCSDSSDSGITCDKDHISVLEKYLS